MTNVDLDCKLLLYLTALVNLLIKMFLHKTHEEFIKYFVIIKLPEVQTSTDETISSLIN